MLGACSSDSSDDSDSPGSNHTQTIHERLQTALDQAVARGLPAAALAIRGPDVQFNGVSGKADLQTAEAVTQNHRFYIASTGKTYLGVAAVQIAADGIFNLDDVLTRWLPTAITDALAHSDKIRIRHLLNHTSGIFDFQNDGEAWIADFIQDLTRQWSNADVLPYFVSHPLFFEPGTRYRYSNSNYILLTLVIEAATGRNLSQNLRNRIFEPLGLMNTLHGDEAIGIANLVHGYSDNDGEINDVYP